MLFAAMDAHARKWSSRRSGVQTATRGSTSCECFNLRTRLSRYFVQTIILHLFMIIIVIIGASVSDGPTLVASMPGAGGGGGGGGRWSIAIRGRTIGAFGP